MQQIKINMTIILNIILSLIALIISLRIINKIGFFIRLNEYISLIKNDFVIILKNDYSDDIKEKKINNFAFKFFKINFILFYNIILISLPFLLIILADFFIKFNFVNYILGKWFFILLIIFIFINYMIKKFFNTPNKRLDL